MVSSVNTAIDNNNFVNRSPFFEPSRHRRSIEIDGDHDHPAADDEPKCTLNGATFNLMNQKSFDIAWLIMLPEQIVN